jgi:hypothetical protein
MGWVLGKTDNKTWSYKVESQFKLETLKQNVLGV